MLKKLELPFDAYIRIILECKNLNILFMSTPYSFDDVDFLETLNVPAYKIASGQIIECPFLEHVARNNKPIFLSTGMATLAEVDEAVRTIRTVGNDKIVLLQCTTNYPSRVVDANLLAMKTMMQSFQVLVGYSDHTQTDTACIASIALGACVIEKHFTLDKSLQGPDHSTSYSPIEFSRLVSAIREAEMVLGSGIKEPCAAEIENAKGMRRSIVSRVPLRKGERISIDKLTFKRPATGLNPIFVSQLIGKILRRDISIDHMFSWDDVE
jgi:N-acetylneuraminate synthase/N,N'-diacetyllegionaminate synthase